jgi:hypothetical protein
LPSADKIPSARPTDASREAQQRLRQHSAKARATRLLHAISDNPPQSPGGDLASDRRFGPLIQSPEHRAQPVEPFLAVLTARDVYGQLRALAGAQFTV